MSQAPGPSVGLTIGSAAFPTLSAQPFGYNQTDTSRGLTARQWQITGPLKPSEWLTLITAYETWRDARIVDATAKDSLVVGQTVSFSGTGAGGTTWTNIPCWFTSAPSAEQQGFYLQASITLVDAAQAAQIASIQKEEESGSSLDLGTIVLGGATIKLTNQPETYSDGPQLELTAAGTHYITGALVPVRIRNIKGTTQNWTALKSWYESTIRTRPGTGSLFPTSPPIVDSVEEQLVGGSLVLVYEVSLTLTEVI
jgi:hypothetical protein